MERWKTRNAEIVKHPVPTQGELWGEGGDPEEHDGDFLSDDDLDAVEILDPKEYNIEHILDDTFADLDQLVEFLNLGAKVDPAKDDKLKALVRLLKSDKAAKGRKVLLFTEFADTARYLHRELQKAGVEGVEKIDGSSNQRQRSDAIRRFAPYYNGSSAGEITAKGQKEIRILIATDILAEGLNLQDANRLINFDLHWNPVKLMQRIGRVDRRMNPEIEKALCAQ